MRLSSLYFNSGIKVTLKCGIVGLPNVGKSTLFNLLTKAKIPAENYPFCTIEPNIGVVEVPDHRLNEISKIVNPKKIQKATIEFVDIAGLIGGASKGEGLGNQFLSNIRQTDAMIEVIRCFESPEITHVYNKIDPVSDAETIKLELCLSDLSVVEKALKNKNNSKKLVETLELARSKLEKGEDLRTLSEENLLSLKSYHLLSSKPLMYLANIDASKFALDKLKEYAIKENIKVIALSLLSGGDPLNDLINAAYDLLGLQTFFTVGEKELRAWTIKKGDLAPEAAGVIHSDFEKGFIRAEVVSYSDFINYGVKARQSGKLRSEGKNYVVQDGDVINFLFKV